MKKLYEQMEELYYDAENLCSLINILRRASQYHEDIDDIVESRSYHEEMSGSLRFMNKYMYQGIIENMALLWDALIDIDPKDNDEEKILSLFRHLNEDDKKEFKTYLCSLSLE